MNIKKENKNLILLILLFFSALIVSSCSNSENNYVNEFEDENGYIDGTYCAEINYHNPETGTSSTYNLNVEVENNEVTKIYWGNGGWLDDDHFYPEELNSDGFCSFTSDKGYEYEVQIMGEECSYTDISIFKRDVENDIASITCPKCGNEKDSYDDYCDDCQNDIDHTCPRCGKIDRYMYSSDDYCGSCEDDIESTCKKCGKRRSLIINGRCGDCH